MDVGGLRMSERFFLYDDIELRKSRFVSFMGENSRFDLAIIHPDRYYWKTNCTDIEGGRFAIIGHDDLEEERLYRACFSTSEIDALELSAFLSRIYLIILIQKDYILSLFQSTNLFLQTKAKQ